MNHTPGKVRLDKWLWAARFFKTRSLAKQAIAGGKVHYEGARVKVSKDVEPGASLTVRQGWDEKTVEVLALSDKRGNASIAATLYQETAASIQARADQAALRKAASPASQGRPSKRERRQIHRFVNKNSKPEA